MKSKLLLLCLFLLRGCSMEPVIAQNVQPQQSFAGQMLYAFSQGPSSPSGIYLNFNDFSTSFKEQITNVNFITPASQTFPFAGNPTTSSSTTAGRVYFINVAVSQTGTLSTISAAFNTACATTPPTFVYGTNSGSSFTITNSSAVTGIVATTAVQSLSNGTNFTLPGGTSTTWIGFWSATGGCTLLQGTGSPGAYYFAAPSSLPSGANTYTFSSSQVSFSATFTTTNGAVLTRQLGFDNTLPNNTSAGYAYNTYSYAPNFTLGNYEWTQPFSLIFQLDGLNWGRTGTKYLLSKGYVGSTTQNSWALYLSNSSGGVTTHTQICFVMEGAAGGQVSKPTICSAVSIENPNGPNYEIAVTWDGTGNVSNGASPGLNLYVNALSGTSGTPVRSNGGIAGFGGASVAVAGSGTGYANSTPVVNSTGSGYYFGTLTSSGGVPASIAASALNNYGFTSTPSIVASPYIASVAGSGTGYANSTAWTGSGGGCLVPWAGTFASSGGVPTGAVTYTTMSYCTSAPTLTMTAPTGTGATLTATASAGSGVTLTPTLYGFSLLTSSSALCVAGQGTPTTTSSTTCVPGSTNSAEGTTYVDELAVFPYVMSQTNIDMLFAFTKFQQKYLLASTARPKVICSDDQGDPDNYFFLAQCIVAHQLGYINLVEAIQTVQGNGTSIPSGIGQATYRQMLDLAGLNNVSVTYPAGAIVQTTSQTAANITTFNASTSTVVTTYPDSTTTTAQILCNNPTTPVFWLNAGAVTDMANLLKAGTGTNTCGLTGQALWNRNAANGAAVYLQGLSSSTTNMGNLSLDYSSAQYIFDYAHGGGYGELMPFFFIGGIPQNTGPGVYQTRTSKDPLYLYLVSVGSDARSAFDSQVAAQFFTSIFTGGVDITIGGSGTGYPTLTPFTSTGGGTNCKVSGNMVSSGGVPASISYDISSNTVVAYNGIGSGCTSAPTLTLAASSGSGATLTASGPPTAPVYGPAPPTLSTCGSLQITSATIGQTYATGGCSGTTPATTNSYIYFVQPSINVVSGYTPFLSWILNGMDDPPQQQRPIPQ